jgi:hypothetical protein
MPAVITRARGSSRRGRSASRCTGRTHPAVQGSRSRRATRSRAFGRSRSTGRSRPWERHARTDGVVPPGPCRGVGRSPSSRRPVPGSSGGRPIRSPRRAGRARSSPSSPPHPTPSPLASSTILYCRESAFSNLDRRSATFSWLSGPPTYFVISGSLSCSRSGRSPAPHGSIRAMRRSNLSSCSNTAREPTSGPSATVSSGHGPDLGDGPAWRP